MKCLKVNPYSEILQMRRLKVNPYPEILLTQQHTPNAVTTKEY